ncbi:related to molybdenum cofactor sulfurase [Ustilago trichophora]|uniref:Related to molybdenum cofactor sulfurase n=1 Tax=Ustilago trichophora TaxID=86804 RepID=A0A5C3E854_9BASI|nr:related to molybdenum cofactor sulfurase [Ustilago trichophora]
MVVTLIKAVHTTAKTSSLSLSDSLSYHRSKSHFISSNPSYPDSSLTSLRKREFSRLDSNGGSVYLDYTGASLYPSSLISDHAKWLKRSVAGNPHSTSPSSLLSSRATQEARKAVLEFFDADEAEYDLVWTANATAGFRIVGETYDWQGKKVLIPRDAHNSLNSLAKKAEVGGGSFEFVEFDSASSSSDGGQRDTISIDAYLTALSRPSNSQDASGEKGLVFFTGQSNITGAKLALSPLLGQAKNLGWDIGLDAAALAPTTRISLRTHSSVDFMVVSLYKICGYPTGLGALIMKKSMYAKMTKKQTFFGGNIVGITMDRFDFTLVDGPERFEDGTANFTAMAAVKPGLEFAARWMESVAKRNRMLLEWLVKELDSVYYPVEGEKEGFDEKQSFSSSSSSSSSSSFSSTSHKNPSPAKAVKLVRIGGPTSLDLRGFTLPLVFTSSSGDSLNYRFVIWCAAQESISLRGGPCMCNPGASSSVMQRGLITDLEASSLLAVADVGIVRVSLGVASNFKDVWRLVHFARKLTDLCWVEKMWKSYQECYPQGCLSNNIDELQALATRKR